MPMYKLINSDQMTKLISFSVFAWKSSFIKQILYANDVNWYEASL